MIDNPSSGGAIALDTAVADRSGGELQGLGLTDRLALERIRIACERTLLAWANLPWGRLASVCWQCCSAALNIGAISGFCGATILVCP